MSRAFTLIELVVSIAIFAFMTALVVAKYGTFNQGTVVTNMAYDVALSIRTAQSYGLSVKSTDASGNASFSSAYGVHFEKNLPTQYTFFSDGTATQSPNGRYDALTDTAISTYRLTQGAHITGICLGDATDSCSSVNAGDTFDITFKRPNPEAVLMWCYPSCYGVNGNAYITISSADGTNNQLIVVRKNGQISVGE